MKKKLKPCFFLAFILFSLFAFSSCDPTSNTDYPLWFNEYSVDNLTNLKSAQDTFNCFGNSIGDNLISHDIDYWEDEDGKHLLITFWTKDDGPLDDNRDIKPFRDAFVANGFVLDNDPESVTYNQYIKDDIVISIYVIQMEAPDAHFEIMADKT